MKVSFKQLSHETLIRLSFTFDVRSIGITLSAVTKGFHVLTQVQESTYAAVPGGFSGVLQCYVSLFESFLSDVIRNVKTRK